MKKKLLIALAVIVSLLALPLLAPEHARIPVQGATPRDWNPRSFWHGGWGASGVHKGIDIFAPKGRPVIAATGGLVIYAGELSMGGNVAMVLGPKWRVHYYAHLSRVDARAWRLVRQGGAIGAVGDSGNARGKPPHLHYTVVSVLPLPWRRVDGAQGWKRMYFLDPAQVIAAH